MNLTLAKGLVKRRIKKLLTSAFKYGTFLKSEEIIKAILENLKVFFTNMYF